VPVTAFLVDHGPVKPAFGYRVDYQRRSVVLSGDTKPPENLIKFAKGEIFEHPLQAAENAWRAVLSAAFSPSPNGLPMIQLAWRASRVRSFKTFSPA